MYPTEITSQRKISYPSGNGAVMTFTKGQLIRSLGCAIHSIIEYTYKEKPSYTEIHLELPGSEVFVWKKVYSTGVVVEYEIDSLL